MREISRTTISSKSPRQRLSSSCLRTAGAGSTGMNAANFIAAVTGSVASVPSCASPQVACVRKASRSVASEFVASASGSKSSKSGASNLLPTVSRSVRVSRSFVASSSLAGAGLASSVGSLGPVALVSRQLRQRSVLLRSVASGCVGLRRSGPRIVALQGVECSPRIVLRKAFQELAEAARDNVSERMSRRLGRTEDGGPTTGLTPSVRVAEDCVVRVRVGPVRVVSLRQEERPASHARAWRLH